MSPGIPPSASPRRASRSSCITRGASESARSVTRGQRRRLPPTCCRRRCPGMPSNAGGAAVISSSITRALATAVASARSRRACLPDAASRSRAASCRCAPGSLGRPECRGARPRESTPPGSLSAPPSEKAARARRGAARCGAPSPPAPTSPLAGSRPRRRPSWGRPADEEPLAAGTRSATSAACAPVPAATSE